jgi:hypothetical protein
MQRNLKKILLCNHIFLCERKQLGKSFAHATVFE